MHLELGRICHKRESDQGHFCVLVDALSNNLCTWTEYALTRISSHVISREQKRNEGLYQFQYTRTTNEPHLSVHSLLPRDLHL